MTEGAGVDFGIVGAGPAGLAAAYDLEKRGRQFVVFEKDDQVGGLSKTVNYHGYRCDIGGHRFFTKSEEVNRLWHAVLPDDFLRRRRLSRIYYRGRLFNYPIRPLNALRGLGVATSLAALGSFALRRVFPKRPEVSFEDWVSNRFGKKMYEIFFKTYTQKVWGIRCSELSADWAAQRIRNLSLGRAVLNAMGIGKGRQVASLIEEFDYPRYGPGQMYEAMAQQAAAGAGRVRLGCEVAGVRHAGGAVRALTIRRGQQTEQVPVRNLISSMPLTELVLALQPAPQPEVLRAARALRYRSILTVNVIVRAREVLPDTWVYLHSPKVRAGRLQLYKNWSPDMVPDPAMSILGLEYFCWEGDDLWKKPEDELFEIAAKDLAEIDVIDPAQIEDHFVVRYAKAYPVYEGDYRKHLRTIRQCLGRLENLVCVGRYGQFRYNNMDHSILSALLGVRRLLGEPVDPWAINEEAEYLEEKAFETEG